MRRPNVRSREAVIPGGFGIAALFAGATAALMAASFPAPNVGPVAWVALVPAFVWMGGRSWRAVALFFFAVGILFFGTALSWIAALTPPGLAVLILILAVYSMIAGLLIRRVGTGGWIPGPIAIAAAWTVVEFARGTLFSGFPWLLLGHTQYRFTVVTQVADLGGVHAVTFLLVWSNAAIAACVRELVRRSSGAGRRITFHLLPLGIVLAFTLLYGGLRVSAPPDPPGPVLTAIQANIPVSLKHDPMSSDAVLREHLRWTQTATRQRDSDLVIWSETMYPAVWDQNASADLDGHRTLVRDIVREWVDGWFLFGVPFVEAGPEDPYSLDHRRRNRAILFDPDGREAGVYDKTHLVPIGEFLPFRRYLPLRRRLEELICRIAGWVPSLTSGELSPVLDLEIDGERIPFGVMICFDSVFPDVARRSARDGARFLVNISNDGWYGKSAELEQILAITTFRAIETRLPVFRATNTGISAVIDSRGRIVERLRGTGRDGTVGEKEVAGFLTRAIGLGRGDAPYRRVGDLFALSCCILVVAGVPRRRSR